MRALKIATSVTAVILIMAVPVTGAVEERGQRGGRGGGGGAPQLAPEDVLENFHRIVEVIWTDEEEDAWGDARSDEQKQAFIAAFWERRDPTPGTPDNEFRDVYMGRVAAAVTAFRGEGTEGYRTDRGKVFIVYGGNAMVAQEQRQGGGEMQVNRGGGGEDVSGAGGRGGARAFMWVWTMDTEINPFLEDKEELIFAPFQGSFTLSTRGLELSEEAFLANADVQQLFEARRANPTASMAGAGAGPGGGADAAPEIEAMRALMEESIERNDLTLQQDFSFFPAPGGATYTVVSFEVGKEGLTYAPDNVKAFGLVLRDDPDQGEVPVHQIDATFTVAEDEGDEVDSGTHTFSVTLVPGQHRLAWGLMDGTSRRIVSASRPFVVPDFGTEELMLTSVAMALSPMRQTQDPIDTATVYDVTRIGGLELDVDVDRVFGRGDTIALLYFVMGAAMDPGSGQNQLEVTHRVLREDDQSIAVLPTQTMPFSAIAQSIPLSAVSQIEAGQNYKIQIEVKDLISGQEITREVPFSTAAAGSRP